MLIIAKEDIINKYFQEKVLKTGDVDENRCFKLDLRPILFELLRYSFDTYCTATNVLLFSLLLSQIYLRRTHSICNKRVYIYIKDTRNIRVFCMTLWALNFFLSSHFIYTHLAFYPYPKNEKLKSPTEIFLSLQQSFPSDFLKIQKLNDTNSIVIFGSARNRKAWGTLANNSPSRDGKREKEEYVPRGFSERTAAWFIRSAHKDAADSSS